MHFFVQGEKPKWYITAFNAFAGATAGLCVTEYRAIALIAVFPFAWALAHCLLNHWSDDYRLMLMEFTLEARRSGRERVIGLPPAWAFYLLEALEAFALSMAAGSLVVGVKIWAGLL